LLVSIPLLIMPDPCRAEPDAPPLALTREQASTFARLALKGVTKEFPNKPEHVVNGPADVRAPKALHPAFYGCYDWHSCVHGHWMLARLARTDPKAGYIPRARAALARSLTHANIAGEVAYQKVEGHVGFERPYGLAWLLQLAAELREWKD